MTENSTTSTQTNIDINKTFKMFNSARKSKLFSLSSHKHRSSHNNSILTHTNSIFLSPNITTKTKPNLDSLLEQIKNDKEYSQYKLIKQKITTINKSNLIVKQIDFEISHTLLQFKPHSTSKQHQHQQSYDKTDFLKLRQQHIHIKKPKDTSIIKEQDLLSSGSYDSDYFDLDDSYNNIFEKKIEAIRSLKYPNYIEDKMKEDIGSLTVLLKKINN